MADIKAFKENLQRLYKNDTLLVISFFIISLLIRGFILQHSENVKLDAISRIMIAQKLLESPYLVKSGVWLPLHFYLIALSLKIFYDPLISPRLVNLLLGSLTIVPYFYLIKLVFNRNAAIFSSIVLILYPMHVNNSVTSLSGVPFNFFVFISLYLFFSFKERLKKGSQDMRLLVMSAVALNLANMIRYEGWMLIPILTLFLYRAGRRYLFIFFIISMIFPAMWMWENYTIYGDPLIGTSFPSKGHKQIISIKGEDVEEFTKITSAPEILTYTLSPLITIFGFIGIIYSFRNRYRIEIATISTFIVGIFLIKILKGELVLQPRYTILLGMLIIPYSYIAIEKIAVLHRYTGLKLMVFISILSVILTGYIYNAGYFTHDYGYVYDKNFFTPYGKRIFAPYATEDSRAVARWLNENIEPDKNLIIDWNKYRTYIALYSEALNPGKVNTLYYIGTPSYVINLALGERGSNTDIKRRADNLYVVPIIPENANTRIPEILNNGTYLVYSPDEGVLRQFLNLSLKCSQQRYNYSFDIVYYTKELYIYYISDSGGSQKQGDDTDPVAHYNFDEDIMDIVCDDSGNNNDGIIKGAGLTDGRSGTGLNFSSTSTRMTVRDTPALRGPDLTISAWIKITEFNSSLLEHRIVSKTIWKNATDNAGYSLVVDPKRQVFVFKILNNGVTSLKGNTKLDPDRWYHVAVTYDGTYMRLYVNGVEDGNKLYTGGIKDTTGRDMEFSTGWFKGYFVGVIDDVRIWNRSLSGAEILDVYNTKS